MSSVIVITGASSGIGRATAETLARRGARLVLAARSRDALETVAAECLRRGGDALVVPTDVTDAAAMRSLAAAAISQFGRIDVWINNAGVGAVGRFEETPIDAHRRVIEINLIGHVNGAHAALTHFRRKGEGILINVISVGGWLSAPYAAAYSASKFGLRALGQSLRAELSASPNIHVCDVYPGFIDTPGVSHGANYSGRNLKPVPPLLSPERVAERIADLVHRPRAITAIGSTAWMGRLTHDVAPELRGRILRALTDFALSRADASALTSGNLFEPSRSHAVSGGYRGRHRGLWIAAGVVGVLAVSALMGTRHAGGRLRA